MRRTVRRALFHRGLVAHLVPLCVLLVNRFVVESIVVSFIGSGVSRRWFGRSNTGNLDGYQVEEAEVLPKDVGKVGEALDKYKGGDAAEVVEDAWPYDDDDGPDEESAEYSCDEFSVVEVDENGTFKVEIENVESGEFIAQSALENYLRRKFTTGDKAFRVTFDADDLGQLKLVFQWLDLRQRGLIIKEDFVRGFRLFPGPYGKLSKAEVSYIFHKADANKDGFLDETEFIFWIVRTSHVLIAFQTADLNEDGFIDLREWRHTIKTTHPKLGGPNVDSMFSRFDKNSDGRISFTEYMEATEVIESYENVHE